MKTKFTLLAVLFTLITTVNAQQAPNAGFETWTAPGQPQGWATIESVFAGQITGFTSQDQADKVEGTSSVKIMTDSVAGQPQAGIISGFVSTGIGTYVTGQPIAFTGIPFAFRPDTLSFSYKFTSPGIDTPGFQIFLSKNHVHSIAGGEYLPQSSTWAEVAILLTPLYTNQDTPDSLTLQFLSSFKGSTAQGVVGSTLHVDNVHFGYVGGATSGIDAVSQDAAINVYRTTRWDVINIVSSKNLEGSNLEIFNLAGQVVLKNEFTSNTFSTASLSNGTYLYRVTNKQGELVTQNKLVIVK